MKILLGIDPSPGAQVAMEEVASRPWPKDSSFEVVSVVEPSHLWTTSEVALEAAHRAHELVEQAVEYLRAEQPNVTGVTLVGNPKAALVNHARTTDTDFIFLGSHGVSGLERFLLGSVAAGILREAPCSVAIVRARQRRPIQKVLLATDGSECSDRAADSIAERPWPPGTEIRVLSVVELVLPTSYALFEPPVDTAFVASERAQAMKRCQDGITRAREILAMGGLHSSESISVLVDPPRATILNEAAEWGADLIVLGSHGYGRIDRLLLGSVSESVAMHASCSVEVIRTR